MGKRDKGNKYYIPKGGIAMTKISPKEEQYSDTSANSKMESEELLEKSIIDSNKVSVWTSIISTSISLIMTFIVFCGFHTYNEHTRLYEDISIKYYNLSMLLQFESIYNNLNINPIINTFVEKYNDKRVDYNVVLKNYAENGISIGEAVINAESGVYSEKIIADAEKKILADDITLYLDSFLDCLKLLNRYKVIIEQQYTDDSMSSNIQIITSNYAADISVLSKYFDILKYSSKVSGDDCIDQKLCLKLKEINNYKESYDFLLSNMEISSSEQNDS
jgi:hypothetical protein